MKKIFVAALLLFAAPCFAQDAVYVRKTLQTLTSPVLWGRGYTKNGMTKAADFIANELKTFGLLAPDGKNYLQPFTFPVNTFPGKMEVVVDGKTLTPGKDFIVAQASKGLSAKTKLQQRDSVTFLSPEARLAVVLENKLTWSVATNVEDFTEISILKSAIAAKPQQIAVDIENQFIPEFKASNICGLVKGTAQPDSLIVMTAHYDHLGGMGAKTFFPGANDNASGVSFLLSLAKYYAKNPQRYSMVFIFFAGEEAGILGSKYFTENPTLPLKNIRFLFNFDMVGTGELGATVVNATLHPNEFSVLKNLNTEGQLLPKLNSRGPAANSDHYFFTQKGVPAFFLYTQGGISAYHDVFDQSETLPLTVYPQLFNLLVGFNRALMK